MIKKSPAFGAVKPKGVSLEKGHEGFARMTEKLEIKRDEAFEALANYVKGFLVKNPNMVASLPEACAITMAATRKEYGDTQLTLYTAPDKKTELVLNSSKRKKPIKIADDETFVANMDSKASKTTLRDALTDLCMGYDLCLELRNKEDVSLEERYNDLKIRNDILRKNLAEYEDMSKEELVKTLFAIFNTASEMLFAKYKDEDRLTEERGHPVIRDKESGYLVDATSFDDDKFSKYFTLEFTQKGLGHVVMKYYYASHLDGLRTIEVTKDNKTILSCKRNDGDYNTYLYYAAGY